MGIVEQVESLDESRRQLRVSSPANLERIGEFGVQTAADVNAVVERAHKVQPKWAALSFAERGRYLERAIQVLLDRSDDFLDVICAETGKPRVEAYATEILTSCDALQFYAKRTKRMLADRGVPLHLMRTKKLRISYRPLGVVGIITPWNFPFLLALNPTVQALMAGNAVVLKPSEVTPFSGRLVEELFAAAELPESVFNLVLGDVETGAALVGADVDKICFTGSVETGRTIAETCGRNLVPCTLELGGKDPMIVCSDADIVRAARGAVYGAFNNSGHVCTSVERVYVAEDVAEEFTRRVVEETAQLRQGASGEFEVGSLIWPTQLGIIESHVADAVAKGARVLTGGRRNPDLSGYFYEPTVLADVNHDMAVMRDETFGPVLPIMRVPDEGEALRLANDSRYGLSANVWTGNKSHGMEIAGSIQSGDVVVNDCGITYGVTEAPFGGVKESGIGRVNGESGLRGYCRTQSILVDRFGLKREMHWYPHTGKKMEALQRFARFLWMTSIGRFLS